MPECPREDAVNKGTRLGLDALQKCIEEHVQKGDFRRTAGCAGCPKWPFEEKKENKTKWPEG